MISSLKSDILIILGFGTINLADNFFYICAGEFSAMGSHQRGTSISSLRGPVSLKRSLSGCSTAIQASLGFCGIFF